jgi:ribosomal protein L4
VEELPNDGKTKTMHALRKVLPGSGASTLLLNVDGGDLKTGRAIRNIPDVHMQRAVDVNVSDVLNHKYIIISKEGIDILEKRLG